MRLYYDSIESEAAGVDLRVDYTDFAFNGCIYVRKHQNISNLQFEMFDTETGASALNYMKIYVDCSRVCLKYFRMQFQI